MCSAGRPGRRARSVIVAAAALGLVPSATFAVSTIHVLLRRKRDERALRLQAASRWAFPTTFALAVLLMVVLSFR